VQVADPEEKRLEVIVEDTQLSLAIGKKGQNVRLASKLIGWNIDIKSEEEKRREVEAQMAALTAPGTPLAELKGVGPKTMEKLEAAGVTSVEKLADMTPEQLVEIPGIGEKMVEKIRQAVATHFEALEGQPATAEAVEGGASEGEARAEAEAANAGIVEEAAQAEGLAEPEAVEGARQVAEDEAKAVAEAGETTPVEEGGSDPSGKDSEGGAEEHREKPETSE
jgi:N utilization substance protein A